MTSDEPPKTYRTLRGYLEGEEPAEENYFHHSATLRIHGDNVPFEELSQRLGVQPTHIHRRGVKRQSGVPWRDDAWHFQPPLAETEPLGRHLEALWSVVRPHVDYLKGLKQTCRVDVFCGYRSNCDLAGLEIPHHCLEMFMALEIPLGVSVIIA